MISIIIPTYNESANIKKIAEQLNKLIFKKEIIFVDDNSQDSTALNIRKGDFFHLSLNPYAESPSRRNWVGQTGFPSKF